MFKSKKILKLGCLVYGSKVHLILIDCDKLLFLKKYKNMWNLVEVCLYEKRLYSLIYKLLKYRIKYLCY
jgi:hypothetical protein